MWPLPPSLPVPRCHMPIGYQHIVSYTLISLCLFICIPVYQGFLSLCESSLALSPNPSPDIRTAPAVHLLLKASWELICLFLCLLVYSCSSIREGWRQLSFLQKIIVLLRRHPEGYLIPSPAPSSPSSSWKIYIFELSFVVHCGCEGSPCVCVEGTDELVIESHTYTPREPPVHPQRWPGDILLL